MTDTILDYLAALVACDTQNPPRQITTDGPLIRFLDSVCRSRFKVQVNDYGDGRLSYWARRGMPNVLFNVHLDTVPASDGWTSDPFQLSVANGRAVGLGACDIKGAAACILALATRTDQDMALLFTTDEEGFESCCVQRSIESWPDNLAKPALTVVAEPTGGRAVFGHRGYLSQQVVFQGASSHTSIPKNQRRSALHRLVEWSSAALRWVDEAEAECGNDADFCFNLGKVEGGIKNNMVADRAEVRWSARLPPSYDTTKFLAAMKALPHGTAAEWHTTFYGLPFPKTSALREHAIKMCLDGGAIPSGRDVDFWTEASIFSDSDWPTVVLGPGDIAQAHSPNESVAVDQLHTVYDQYQQIAHGL